MGWRSWTTGFERSLIVWLSLSSAAAFAWPRFSLGVDPFLSTKPYLSYFIAAAMFAIGRLLPREELLAVARRWPLVVAGTTLQYVSMPLLAYACARLLRLEGDLFVGVMIVGCVPGAMASNVLTLLARGNVSYSLTLTTTSTLLSPLVVPLALWLTLGQSTDFPALQTAQELVLFVVLPVLLGHLLGSRLAAWHHVARPVGKLLANLVLLWVIAVVVAANRERFDQWQGRLLLGLIGLNAGGYLAGYVGGLILRLPVAMRRALTLEIGMQNAGVGSMLALALFPDRPLTAMPSALYTFGCMFTGTLLAIGWSFASVPDADPTDGSSTP